MTSIRKTTVLAFCLSAIITACGGGDDVTDISSGGGGGTPTLTCDSAQFTTAATAPTTAQLETFSKTLYKGDKGTLDGSFNFTKTGTVEFVLSSSGLFMMDNVTVDTKSMCYVASDNMIVVSWGTKNTVGSGVVYDNHVDLKEGGKFNGTVDSKVVRSAS